MSQSDLNWQMTGFFLLALVLMGFVMKLVALLLPVTASSERAGIFWLLLSPNALKRLQPAIEPWRIVLQTLLWLGAVLLSYQIYWWLVSGGHIRGFLLSYAALPVLLVMMEFLAAMGRVLGMIPSGQLLPPLHCRLWLTRGLADFWGRRWNLWFSDWFRYSILSRLRRPVLALFLIFAVSGVMHEWVINVPLYYLTGTVWFGSMMVYFPLQAAGILVERRFLKGHDFLRVAFAWLVILAPAPLIMNEGLLRTLHLWPE